MSLMGARLCTLRHLISGQKCKSPPGRRNSGSYSFKKENRRMLMETGENKKILARQDWILASPSTGLKPDYLKSSSSNYKQSPSKKKVHPACSSRLRGSLISEAKDSLCLDRPIMSRSHDPEGGEGLMPNCSSIIKGGLIGSGKSQKRVRFKLPHTVIFYSPEPEEHNRPCGREDSIFSPNCGENSFDSAEEPCFRLAVDILPHLSVSSKI